MTDHMTYLTESVSESVLIGQAILQEVGSIRDLSGHEHALCDVPRYARMVPPVCVCVHVCVCVGACGCGCVGVCGCACVCVCR